MKRKEKELGENELHALQEHMLVHARAARTFCRVTAPYELITPPKHASMASTHSTTEFPWGRILVRPLLHSRWISSLTHTCYSNISRHPTTMKEGYQ